MTSDPVGYRNGPGNAVSKLRGAPQLVGEHADDNLSGEVVPELGGSSFGVLAESVAVVRILDFSPCDGYSPRMSRADQVRLTWESDGAIKLRTCDRSWCSALNGHDGRSVYWSSISYFESVVGNKPRPCHSLAQLAWILHQVSKTIPF